MAYQTILYETKESVAVITLNRPEVLNAITDTMQEELQDALDAAEAESQVRALVLTGAGRGFCTGQDVRAMAQSSLESQHRLERYETTLLRLHTIEKPVIGAINGVAVGAGCNLALACDLRIASDQASLGQVFVRIGLGPDTGASYFTPRLVGMARAAELLFTGRIVDATEAERIGLVNRVVPHQRLMEEVMALAASLAQGPTKAIGAAKRALRFSLHHPLEEAVRFEHQLQRELVQTQDHQEGVAAFREKRQPHFTGQ
ncbi:MAG: enoyl-CoA hydratase/isomerase family protein [Dehalococcoidia bacterium]